MIQGKDLILSINGKALAGARNCSIDRSADVIEVCSPTDGSARKYMASTTSWQVSSSGLMVSEDKAIILRDIMASRTPVTIYYKVGVVTESGSAILTSLQETGEIGALAKFSISMQGSGALAAVGSNVDLSTLAGADADDAILVENGDSWSVDQDQDGVRVLTLNNAKNYKVGNIGSGPVVLITATGTSASTIAGAIEAGNITQLLNTTEAVILPGDVYIVRSHTHQHFLLVNSEQEYASNCTLFMYS